MLNNIAKQYEKLFGYYKYKLLICKIIFLNLLPKKFSISHHETSPYHSAPLGEMGISLASTV